MALYEFNGEAYRKASKHQKEWGARLMEKLHLRGDESILDLGCGDGSLTKALSELVKGGNVVGIDASEGMIQAAKPYESDNLHFRCMDIQDLCEKSVYDVIYSNAALHWVKGHSRLLQNCHAALKPRGKILWNFAGDGTCKNFIEAVRSVMEDPVYRCYFQNFEWPWYMPSKPSYQALAQQAAFSTISVTEENADRYFAHADEMIQWLDQPSLVPFIKCVPDGKKEAFRSKIIEGMLQKTAQPDGSCFETFRRIQVSAVK